MNIRSLLDIYNPVLSARLVTELRQRNYSGRRLLAWFWQARSYTPTRKLSDVERSLAVLLGLGMLAQIALGIGLLVQWARFGTAGTWEFGAALLLSYPLVGAHVLVLLAWIGTIAWSITHPKQAARAAVCTVLEWQVRQLRARHKFKVVAVVGSLGKTSTKHAISQLLGQNLRVRTQAGNYNDRVTVPLVFFGLQEPSLYNVFAWLKVFGATQSEIALPYPYDVVVVELGTDAPGQIEQFAYLKPDIAVVTAVAPEHMEFFGTLDAVAAEELKVFDFAKKVLVNGDDTPGEYLAGREFVEYSLRAEQAEYHAGVRAHGFRGNTLQLTLRKKSLTAQTQLVGDQGAKFALAAAATADMLGVPKAKIATALPQVEAFAGRMQILHGLHGATLIDDTYNAAPISMKAALDVLYIAKSPQKVAILGSINEMGSYAHEAHTEVGSYCNPKKLDLVVMVGKDAKRWLAPAAKAKGCTVHSFLSPYEAGAFVLQHLKPGAVVLAKGSQNGVYAEEALKQLLANPDDAVKLVRQTTYWQARKAKQFSH